MAGNTGRRMARLWRASSDLAKSDAPPRGQRRAELPGVQALGLDGLLRTIEGEIIPRLVLAHRGQFDAGHCAGAATTAEQVSELTRLVLGGDSELILAYVRSVQRGGVELDTIFLDLIAPVAHRLGEMWLADECDFSTVTLCAWRLQRLLHDVSASFHADAAPPADDRRILLAAMPGEQHTLGLSMVGEFFRKAGWEVADAPLPLAADLVALAGRRWFEVVGISLGSDTRFDALSALVRELRRASRNPSVGIMVGGPAFLDRPEAVVRVGADVSASDGRSAVRVAQDLIGALQQRLRVASGR